MSYSKSALLDAYDYLPTDELATAAERFEQTAREVDRSLTDEQLFGIAWRSLEHFCLSDIANYIQPQPD